MYRDTQYTGRMIEDLIGSVQKAEAHAGTGLGSSEPAVAAWYEPSTYPVNHSSVIEELLGVA
ncbi:MAG TPA: hypothetical protein VLA96_14520 [Terriglobales bacterium]|nr:hypothetical protein [Terriglobales bacterium]